MVNNTCQGSGGRLLIESLRQQQVDHVFLVPGESYLAALDAFNDADDIRLTICRQEGGAAMMAGSYGRMTNRPGVCFVTRGPGATNASAGIHIAMQDSQPLVMFVGQVARRESEQQAFQEIDFRRMFGSLCKWVGQIESAERIPEYVNRAFHIAANGRPGPVVLALPEDMLVDEVEAALVPAYMPVVNDPGTQALDALAGLLAGAQRPMMIVGGVRWSDEAKRLAGEFAHRWQLPVATTFRCDDSFDNDDPCFVGSVGTTISPGLRQQVAESDLLIVVGARLTTLYSPMKAVIDWPLTSQTLIHVFPDPEELGALSYAQLPICADAVRFFTAAVSLAAPETTPWAERTVSMREVYSQWCTPRPCPGELQMADAITWLDAQLPDNAIVTVGAGNYTMWVHRYFKFNGDRCLLGPTSGSMGFSIPAAVAAKRLYPDRCVVAFAGDGCFMMNGQEFATANQYDLNIIVVVVNNGMYGTIRMHQERDYPRRVAGTELKNPDFAALAKAYGGMGFKVGNLASFQAAFEEALAGNKPVIIEAALDPEAISTVTTLSALRSATTGG